MATVTDVGSVLLTEEVTASLYPLVVSYNSVSIQLYNHVPILPITQHIYVLPN
jgi:hypothetical protein